MKPGRELDALVAEKVMGTRLPTYYLDYCSLSASGAINCSYETFVDMQDTWSPSTDIAAAWEVVDKLTPGDSPHFQLNIGYFREWTAAFDLNRPLKRVTAIAGTAPHAICLAALKALGVEV